MSQERIEELIQQALQAISNDEFMEVARQFISLKDPSGVNEAMRVASDTPEAMEQMIKLRACFLELLDFK